jgi:MoxR-like ATPase
MQKIFCIKNAVKDILVSDAVKKYIVDIVYASRNHKDIFLGASPRGSIALYNMGQALAFYRGREYVIPDDIKYLAPHVLPHRFILTHEARISKKSRSDIIEEILREVEVPINKKYREQRKNA